MSTLPSPTHPQYGVATCNSGGVVSHMAKVVDMPRLAIRDLDKKEYHDGGESAMMVLIRDGGVGVPEVVTIGVDENGIKIEDSTFFSVLFWWDRDEAQPAQGSMKVNTTKFEKKEEK